jgi:6-phosphogluconolactonase/glucosamine-6-phosphate isomerase/deaminase
MRVSVFPDQIALARAAAHDAASRIRTAVAASGQARIVVATGTSQMTFLDRLL